MRLQSYLTERENPFLIGVKEVDKILPKIKSQCKPWLSKIKSNPNAIFRGMPNVESVIKKKVRTDRKPLDMPQLEHEEIDKAFYDAFGWKPRSSGLFVTPEPSRAFAYGNQMLIFPIGKVKYLWSEEIADLYFRLGRLRKEWVDKGGRFTLLTVPPEQGIKLAQKEQIFDLVISKYKETMITKALETRTEIMLQCKEYYALPGPWCLKWLGWKKVIPFAKALSYKYDRAMFRTFMEEAILK